MAGPALRALFKAPTYLYGLGLGWLLGKRFLQLTHRGRHSGNLYRTVLEVVEFDQEHLESVVVSAFGSDADWYRNLQEEPALRVRTGRLDYAPDQRFLTIDEARNVAIDFCEHHRLEAKLAPRVLPAIGAAIPNGPSDPVEVLASLPMVAFRPTT